LQHKLDMQMASSKKATDTIESYLRAFNDGMKSIHTAWNAHDSASQDRFASHSSSSPRHRDRRSVHYDVSSDDDDHDDQKRFFHAPMHAGRHGRTQDARRGRDNDEAEQLHDGPLTDRVMASQLRHVADRTQVHIHPWMASHHILAERWLVGLMDGCIATNQRLQIIITLYWRACSYSSSIKCSASNV
jgi:hypothetical protein